MAGVKYDVGKLRYDLIPPEVLEALASVLTHGADKYGDDNWKDGIQYNRVYAALERHLQDWRKGNLIDKDSELPAIWHVLANICFLVYFESKQDKYENFIMRWRVEE